MEHWSSYARNLCGSIPYECRPASDIEGYTREDDDNYSYDDYSSGDDGPSTMSSFIVEDRTTYRKHKISVPKIVSQFFDDTINPNFAVI